MPKFKAGDIILFKNKISFKCRVIEYCSKEATYKIRKIGKHDDGVILERSVEFIEDIFFLYNKARHPLTSIFQD